MTRKSRLEELNNSEREDLIRRLFSQQNKKCYICQKEIFLEKDEVDIDHIVSLDKKGPDEESNYALTHSGCNRSKGSRDLQLQRYLYNFRNHLEKYTNPDIEDTTRKFTVNEALNEYFPHRDEIHAKIDGGKVQITYDFNGERITKEHPLITDINDNENKSFFALIPLNYIFHDPTINPRSIVDLEPLIEEFYNKNTQLQPCLAHIEMQKDGNLGKILLFDGQHKAAAQMYIGNKELLVRVFVNCDKDKLKETNFRAHTKLAQIHFPQMISDKVGHDIFNEVFSKFASANKQFKIINETNFFDLIISEQSKREYRNYFKSYIKYEALTGGDSEKNKILSFVETVSARSKTFPISYDTLQKSFLNQFLFLYPTDDVNLEEAQKYRELEKNNILKLMNIFTEEILQKKFDIKKGIYKIEEQLANSPDIIPNDHLRAYRMCRQAAMIVWMGELYRAISLLLSIKRRYEDVHWPDDGRVLWADIKEEDWDSIRKMIRGISQHKLWIEKYNPEILNNISSTKQKDWKEIILKGRLPGRIESIFTPIDKNYIFEFSK